MRNLGRKMIAVMFVGLLLLAAVAVSAQDGEPELTTQILVDGDVVSAQFEGATTAYLYAFNATAGDSVTISMTQEAGSDLDPFIVLLGPRGEVITYDDDSGGNLSSLISGAVIPADGSYYIVASSFEYIDAILVTGAEAVAAQPFTLTISGITPPTALEGFDPTRATFYSGRLEAGAVQEGISSLVEPVYYYTFVANAGDVVTIETESSEFATLLYLFGNGGQRLAVNNTDPVDGIGSAIRDIVIPATGEYMVFATDQFFYSAGDADAVLTYTGGTFNIVMNGATPVTGDAVAPSTNIDKGGLGGGAGEPTAVPK